MSPSFPFGIILLLAAAASLAQPIPKIELRESFPALKINRPIWMEEAPDGSGRFFVVGQDGRVVIVRRGTDGGDAKEFLNIVDRKPLVDNE